MHNIANTPQRQEEFSRERHPDNQASHCLVYSLLQCRTMAAPSLHLDIYMQCGYIKIDSLKHLTNDCVNILTRLFALLHLNTHCYNKTMIVLIQCKFYNYLQSKRQCEAGLSVLENKSSDLWHNPDSFFCSDHTLEISIAFVATQLSP